MWRKNALIVGVIALLLGVNAMMHWEERRGLEPPSAGVPRSELEAYKSELARLKDVLELEQTRLMQLNAEMQDLRARVQAMSARGEARAESSSTELAVEPEEVEPDTTASDEDVPGFDSEAIVAAGFRPERVEEFRSRLDQIELERLYVRDQAAREEWLDSPRYAEESAQLAAALQDTRSEFGEGLYDWMLYTNGQPNRVRVANVIPDSPASEAGLQTGDVIVQYDDTRIFGPGELRESTTQGLAGDLTPLDLVRDGEEIRVYVPRGPLGIRLQPLAEEPPGRAEGA